MAPIRRGTALALGASWPRHELETLIDELGNRSYQLVVEKRALRLIEPHRAGELIGAIEVMDCTGVRHLATLTDPEP